jgi:two-component system nitrogen regulation sensor histidine kinase NtrY
MTDTPAADVDPAPPADRRGAVRWLAGWSEERRRNTFLVAYVVAFLVTAVRR